MQAHVRRSYTGLALILATSMAMALPTAEASDLAEGSIIGTVTDESSGQPIAGVTVTAFERLESPSEPAWRAAGKATSDASGFYEIVGLAQGSYPVKFVGDAGGYATEWYDDVEAADSGGVPSDVTYVDVSVGSATFGIDAALASKFPDWYSGNVIRLAGPNRYGTSVAISQEFYSAGVAAAYIARGDDFPDGLAAAPAAGWEIQGPILLTEPDALPSAVAQELARLQPQQIFILGGSAVVSDSVASAASAFTIGPVTRLAGADRYETATAVSTRFYSSVYNGNKAVCIARGDAFPDALAGGSMCGGESAPMLLTPREALVEGVLHELDSLQVMGKFYIIGGEAAVSAAVYEQLVSYVNPGADHDPRVVRLAGPDRFATAAAVYEERSGSWSDVAFVATGRDFPDALSGGAPAGWLNAPILLVDVDHVPPSTASALTDLKPSKIYILGGEAVITEQVAMALEAFIAP